MRLLKNINDLVRHDLNFFRAFQVLIAALCIFIPVIFWGFDPGKTYVDEVCLDSLQDTTNCRHFVLSNPTAGKQRKLDTFFLKSCKSDLIKPDTVFRAVSIIPDSWGFRPSLSHYALGENTYIFGLLYCMAAMMFIYGGVVNIKNDQLYAAFDSKEPWYNIAIGICLLLVVFLPLDVKSTFLRYAHYLFSVLFFVGNIFVWVFFPTRKEKKLPLSIRIAIAVIASVVLALLGCYQVLSILYIEWISLTFIAIHLILKGLR